MSVIHVHIHHLFQFMRFKNKKMNNKNSKIYTDREYFVMLSIMIIAVGLLLYMLMLILFNSEQFTIKHIGYVISSLVCILLLFVLVIYVGGIYTRTVYRDETMDEEYSDIICKNCGHDKYYHAEGDLFWRFIFGIKITKCHHYTKDDTLPIWNRKKIHCTCKKFIE